MNTFRRVGLVVISCIILLLALLCPVSAAMVLEDDFIEESFNNGLMMTPNGTLASTSVTEPNYPSFSPNDIPWKDAPQYVKEILSANLDDFNKIGNPLDFDTPVKVPFVCVRVNGSNAIVYVGWNICVVYLGDINRPVIGRCVDEGYDSSNSQHVYYLSSTLYRAQFKLSDMSCVVDWYDASSDASFWDDGFWPSDIHSVFTYTSALTTPTGKYDLYFYGSNYAFVDSSSGLVSGVSSSKDSGMTVTSMVYMNHPLGFASGSKIFLNQSDYVNTYCQYFVPSIYPDINSGVVNDFASAEDNLVNSYNPDDLSSDINVSIDSSALAVIFNIFDLFITNNSVLVTLIITMLSLGFVALLLNR